MPEGHITTFRLTEADRNILDEAQQTYGLASRSEALRFLIRLWNGSADVLVAAKAAKAKAQRAKKEKR